MGLKSSFQGSRPITTRGRGEAFERLGRAFALGMTLTIEVPERVVVKAAELGVPAETLVSQALDGIGKGRTEPLAFVLEASVSIGCIGLQELAQVAGSVEDAQDLSCVSSAAKQDDLGMRGVEEEVLAREVLTE